MSILKNPHSSSKIVLVGIGHTHALVLKELFDRKITNLDITIISPDSKSPYSGMLTGFIAGLYQEHEIYIDLQPLIKKMKVHFVCDSVTEINFNTKVIQTEKNNLITYDILSINCGGVPDTTEIEGALDYAAALKPISTFQKKFTTFLKTATDSKKTYHVVQVGGGIAGIECTLGFVSRCKKMGLTFQVTLIEAQDEIALNHSAWARHSLKNLLKSKNIKVYLGQPVVRVNSNFVFLKNQTEVKADFIALATPVKPDVWIKKLDLKHDQQFIQINDYLETSVPGVFASGDVARNPERVIPRAGVFAVRQAKTLTQNLLAAAFGLEKIKYLPQKKYLNLIMDGEEKALASRGLFFFPNSKIMWKFKKFIDQKFLRQFN